MNKREAKEMAARLVSCLIEEVFQSKEPFTYDPYFAKEAEGRRLSPKDQERLEEALGAIQDRLDSIGERVLRAHKERDFSVRGPVVDGEPGARWKKHNDRLKRWGWR